MNLFEFPNYKFAPDNLDTLLTVVQSIRDRYREAFSSSGKEYYLKELDEYFVRVIAPHLNTEAMAKGDYMLNGLADDLFLLDLNELYPQLRVIIMGGINKIRVARGGEYAARTFVKGLLDDLVTAEESGEDNLQLLAKLATDDLNLVPIILRAAAEAIASDKLPTPVFGRKPVDEEKLQAVSGLL